MDFDKINDFNKVFLDTHFKGRENLPLNKKDEIKKEEPHEKSPVNPSYWQSSKGITFKGKNKSADEILENVLKEFDSTYSLRFLSDSEKEQNKERLKKAALQGEKAINQCFNYILSIANSFDTDKINNFMELLDILLDKSLDLNEDEARQMKNVMYAISSNRVKFQDQKQRFEKALSVDGVSIQDVISWFEIFPKDVEFKNDDEMAESIFEVSKMLASTDDKTRDDVIDIKLPLDYIKKINTLKDKNKITTNDVVSFHKTTRSWEKSDKKDFYSTLDYVYDEFVQNDNDIPVKTLSLITDRKFISNGLKTSFIREQVSNTDEFQYELIKYLYDISKQKGGYAFCDGEDLQFALDVVSRENLDEFKEYFEKSINEGTPINSVLYRMGCYVNPNTGLFDEKMYDLTKILEEKNNNSLNGAQFGFNSSKVALSLMDSKTNAPNEEAIEFLDVYFFQNKPLKNNKLKSFFDSIKRGYSSTPYYKNASFFSYVIDDCINAMKDNTGSFNKKNMKYMRHIMEMQKYVRGDADFKFFNASKDENGVIDKKKLKFAMQIIEATGDFKTAGDVLCELEKLGDCANEVFEKAVDTFGDKQTAIRNFSKFVETCLGDDDESRERLAFIKKLSSSLDKGNSLILSDKMIEGMKKEENKEIMLDLAKNYHVSGYEIEAFTWALNELKNEDGILDDDIKNEMYKFVKNGVSLIQFPPILKECSSAEEGDYKNLVKKLDVELFNNTIKFFAKNQHLYWDLGCKAFVSAVSGNVDISTLKFKEKVQMLEAYKKIRQEPETSVLTYETLDKLISELDKSLNDDDLFLPVSDEVKNVFISSILGVDGAKENEYSNFEKIMKDSIPLLENMKTGLNLSYSREAFLQDLTQICDNKEKLQILSKKTGMQPIIEEENGEIKIKGYNGVIILNQLDKSDEFESKVYNLMNRFMYYNTVQTGNSKLDVELNKIIKACPEFINTIGKKQHGTHKYTLDIHMLLVLANSINNPDYLKLNSTDKTMLKLSAIFHDIAKQEATVDKGHYEPSSLYARSIIKKFFNNPEARDRVYELIRNHHWLEEYANATDKEKAAERLAYRFRRPNDFDIARIMARSDLKAVSESFYEAHKDALSEDKIKTIEDKLEYFYSTGSALFIDSFVSKEALNSHIETKDGKNYKVVNFHNINNNEDLKNYGFMKGKTKDDLTFLVHMVNNTSIKNSLQIVKQLTSSVNGGVLSESLITPKYKRTYCDRKYGVMLSQINTNVINMNQTNQHSGFEKDFNNVMELIYGTSNSERSNFKNALLRNLGLDKNLVSDSEFAKFYKENIASKDSYSQFRESKEYSLGGKTFTGKELVSALKEFQNSLIDKEEKTHNEIVGYIPKIQAVIAKENSLDKVPDELLEFAYENNLPVVLI